MTFDAERSGQIYRPLERTPRSSPDLVVRMPRPAAGIGLIERTLRQLDERPQFMTWVVHERMNSYLGAKGRIAWIMTAGAALALFLGVVGIYGVTAFTVSQRMPEIGVRLAIGATARHVLWLLTKDGLRPVLIGLATGLAAGLGVATVFAGELSAISPYDPIALGGAVCILAGSALVAILIPARRASRADPTTILRQT
jgi:ABC-type antimicrobial peptide transport system permease subunit